MGGRSPAARRAQTAARAGATTALEGRILHGPTRQRPADAALSAEATALIAAAPAANTTRAYTRAWADYLTGCTQTGRTPMPATSATLASFIAHLTTTPTRTGAPPAPSTIDQVLACVLSAHTKAGMDKPSSAEARAALHAYRGQRAQAGHRTRQAPPITIDVLHRMIAATPVDDTPDPAGRLSALRDRTALLLGFALMGRGAEPAAVDREHLAVVPQGLKVFIPLSKTDRDAAGTIVAVPYGSHPDTCPVRTIQAGLAELRTRGLTSGALLRPVDRFGRIGGEAGWAGRGGTRLTASVIAALVKNAARRAGLDDPDAYSAHSLRAGGATTLAEHGVPTAKIAAQGRWKPPSPTVNAYVRSTERWRDDPMGKAGP
ncbi:tyrosine-type recombinase/integrase [Planomonospora sp. ID91781]|uniref:tyrosine-type recombinase/integrase n=1 Tax=Planomonospora sp. ID91781 TaxID=2738135 RepID=UPI0018C41777|nr:tyrosine-type recombinase/integrase [Planomonospora sp. ID91781]MBG0825921.1 tyrosine-type recombinase/integrase [Planomonospora sp. ID91781]